MLHFCNICLTSLNNYVIKYTAVKWTVLGVCFMKTLKNLTVGMMCIMMVPASVFSEGDKKDSQQSDNIVITDYEDSKDNKPTIEALKSQITLSSKPQALVLENNKNEEFESFEYSGRVLSSIFEVKETEEIEDASESIEEVTETKVEKKKTKKKKKSKKKKSSQGKLIDNFKITAYCIYGHTASGTITTPNRTIAADPSVLPYGTKVIINGQEYTVEDTGGAIRGNRIDIYMSTYSEAINWGVRYVDVYYAE